MGDYLIQLLTNGSVVALPVALIAGAISGLNPCCLPLYPTAAGCCAALRRETLLGNLWIATAFILGASLITTILGVISALAGRMFAGLGSWPLYVLAAVPIVYGLHLLGVFSLPAAPAKGSQLRRIPRGPLGAVIAGILFGLVITPCATPVLAGLLAYVATTGDPVWGGILLFVYGIGLGLPILLVGTAAASLVERLANTKTRRWADHLTGVALVSVGLYLVWLA